VHSERIQEDDAADTAPVLHRPRRPGEHLPQHVVSVSLNDGDVPARVLKTQRLERRTAAFLLFDEDEPVERRLHSERKLRRAVEDLLPDLIRLAEQAAFAADLFALAGPGEGVDVPEAESLRLERLGVKLEVIDDDFELDLGPEAAELVRALHHARDPSTARSLSANWDRFRHFFPPYVHGVNDRRTGNAITCCTGVAWNKRERVGRPENTRF